jgi:arylsulfatase A-like enzyme
VGLSRRDLLITAGAGVAGAAALGVGGRELVHALSTDSDGAEPPPPKPARNIVLIIIDTLRPDHLGSYGTGLAQTPNLDALARESLRFTRVFPEAMPTVPARRSILTGRRAYPFDGWQPWYGMAKRPGWEPIRPGEETLATVLGRRGFWTAYVSDNPFLSHSGTFEPFRRTFDRYEAVLGQRGIRQPADTVPLSEVHRRLPPVMRDDGTVARVRQYLADNGGGRDEDEQEQSGARVFRWGVEALRSAPRQKPFLLVIDSFDPHELWAPPRRYLDMYTDSELGGVADVRYRDTGYLTDAELQLVRATYAAELTMVDNWLGRFLDELKAQGHAEDTVVALVSDHGIFLGEHGLTGKSDSYLHFELIHVPLFIRAPDGRGAGRASDYFATTVDLAPTLMRMTGQEPPESFDGADLSPLLAGEQPAVERPFAYGGYSNFSFVREERWKLIIRNDRSWMRLYDVEADPGELNDLAAGHPRVVERMWRELLGEIGSRPPRYSAGWLQAPPREPSWLGPGAG